MTYNLFTYGALMFPDIIQTLAQRAVRGEPASLNGYAAFTVKDECFPALVPFPDSRTSGQLYRDLFRDPTESFKEAHRMTKTTLKHRDFREGVKSFMEKRKPEFDRIGKDTQKGVIATAKVKAYDEKTMATMAKMGMTSTHHVMVFFTDEKSGAAVASGKAALKIKGVDAKPVMMMQMGTGFGGDVTVAEGMATFEIGTKLEDGKKRQFSIMFHNM